MVSRTPCFTLDLLKSQKQLLLQGMQQAHEPQASLTALGRLPLPPVLFCTTHINDYITGALSTQTVTVRILRSSS